MIAARGRRRIRPPACRCGCYPEAFLREGLPRSADHRHRQASRLALGSDARGRYHRGMTRLDRIARIRIELDDSDPAVWRRVELPLATSLEGLHQVIQAVMLFENCHLFQFNVGDERYGVPIPDDEFFSRIADAKTITLSALAERGIDAFAYTYDFGDDWRHTITIETITPADPALDYPRLLDGARRAPPEDVGGIPGFEVFLDAMADPRHPEHGRLTEWYGGPFDPAELDLPAIDARIGRLGHENAWNGWYYLDPNGRHRPVSSKRDPNRIRRRHPPSTEEPI